MEEPSNLPYTPRRPPRQRRTPLSKLTLVLGGARSGKSRYAEDLLAVHAGRRVYIATAQAFDDEMRDRIAAHRAARDGWCTVEAPLDLPHALLATSRPVLVDCLTLWLTNVLLAAADVAEAVAALERSLSARTAETVLVSNEVGLGIVPDTPLARRFRDEAGRLHQRLAARADSVALLVAGIPMRIK